MNMSELLKAASPIKKHNLYNLLLINQETTFADFKTFSLTVKMNSFKLVGYLTKDFTC